MAEEINLDVKIKRRLRRKPFAPFIVGLVSGEKIKVMDSHQMAICEGNPTVAILVRREGGIFIRKNQIVAVDDSTV